MTHVLDTNHASLILREDHAIITKLDATPDGQVALCVPSVAELYDMVYNSHRVESNVRKLKQLVERFPVLPFDLSAAETFGLIQAELRRIGRPIPKFDVQIAAIARLHGLTVLTADKHFGYVSDLGVENWIA